MKTANKRNQSIQPQIKPKQIKHHNSSTAIQATLLKQRIQYKTQTLNIQHNDATLIQNNQLKNKRQNQNPPNKENN